MNQVSELDDYRHLSQRTMVTPVGVTIVGHKDVDVSYRQVVVMPVPG